MPHPCVLFSSSPYLRYILGENSPKVNPKPKNSNSLYFHSQGTGRKRPPSRPAAHIGSTYSHRHRSIQQPPIGSASRCQHRSIQTQVNTLPPSITQALLKKSPRGVQRGRGFAAPLRFYTVVNSASNFPSISYSPALAVINTLSPF